MWCVCVSQVWGWSGGRRKHQHTGAQDPEGDHACDRHPDLLQLKAFLSSALSISTFFRPVFLKGCGVSCASKWDEAKLHHKPRPQPFDFPQSRCQSNADRRLIGRDGSHRSVKSHLSLVFSFWHQSDESFLTLNICTRKNKSRLKCLLRFLRLWIVSDESVCFVVFVSSSSFSSAALSDCWHVLISQMYLSLSFLLKSISRLLLLGSAYTSYRPAGRGWEDGDTSLLMILLFGDVIWTLHFYSQTFPSVCGWFPQSSAVGWRTLAVKHSDTLFILFSHVTVTVKRANSEITQM